MLSSGWVGIAHLNGKEYEIELKMRSVCTKGKCDMVLVFRESLSVSLGDRVIIRQFDKTIAFGKVAATS